MTSRGLPEEVLGPIRAGFFLECDELLGELEAGLQAMQDGSREQHAVDAVFRAVHSIKGSAGAFGFTKLVRFSHAFESALEPVRAGSTAVDAETCGLLLRAADLLADIVHAVRDGDEETISPEDTESLIAALAALAPAPGEQDDEFARFGFAPVPVALDLGPVSPLRRWTIRMRPHTELYASANEPLLLIRELERLGDMSATLDEEALPDLASLRPEEAYLAWTINLTTPADEGAVRDVFAFVDDVCDLSVEEQVSDIIESSILPQVQRLADPAERAPPAAPTRSIRVDLDRIDRLINLVGELVINQSMLTQRLADAGLSAAPGMELPLDELDHLTRDLQDSVMAMRAQPVNVVFQRLSRVVREVAAATGKQVRLVVTGEDTQVDRTVIEGLVDPLTHMIRNAIDHGIETPADRLTAGKPAQGAVRISAAHRGGRILIEVHDDGHGIDRAAVRQAAVNRGIVQPDAALSDDEIDHLIFAPGFSTMTELSALSGRGVGMDVVKRGVQALGGRIAVTSRPGHGASFALSLPLTLAVLDGMVVSVAGHSLVAPLTTMVESVRPQADEIRRLGPRATLLRFRGEHLPLIDLGMALGYRRSALDPVRGVAMVVEDDAGGRAALLVDEIFGQRQVVIKSLEANYRAVPGVAAATILADGRVALILDVNAIMAADRPDMSEPSPRFATG